MIHQRQMCRKKTLWHLKIDFLLTYITNITVFMRYILIHLRMTCLWVCATSETMVSHPGTANKPLYNVGSSTLHMVSISEIALRPMLAATMMSSCLQLLPAATAFAVATVIDLVHRTSSSGVAWLFFCSGECRAWARHKTFILLNLDYKESEGNTQGHLK